MQRSLRIVLVVAVLLIAATGIWGQPPCSPPISPATPVQSCSGPSTTIPTYSPGMAVDPSGTMYMGFWDNVWYQTPDLRVGPPCGPWQSYPCVDNNGDPIAVQGLTWDADHGVIWAGGLYHISGFTWGGYGDIYQIHLTGPNAVCTYMFHVPGAANVTDLAWDCSDHSSQVRDCV
jgi:hypothetical protein